MQGHAANELNVEVTHAHHALAGLTGDGEGFGQELVQCFAFGQTLLELGSLATQLLVGEGHHLLFEGIDDTHRLEHAFDFTLVLASKKFL